MADWDIKITAPNGANSHLVMNAETSDEDIVSQVTALIGSHRKADVEPLNYPAGTPVQLQPVKPPQGPGRA